MGTEEDRNVIALLEEAVLQIVSASNVSVESWGKNFGDNEVIAMEIRNAMELNQEQWRFLRKRTTEQGFEVEASIGPSITTWQELQRAIYTILSLVSEEFLMVQRTVDETSLRYWILTGDLVGWPTAHGHIGVIKINKEEVRHLNPHYFGLYDEHK